MPERWSRIHERLDDPRVERQLHDYGCGAACAVMLLADRGIAADQLVVSAGLHLPCVARELAERLDAFSASAHRWQGGHLDLDEPPDRELIEELSRFGSWATLLVPGPGPVGHWVVVDGLDEDDMIAVRDPEGSSYRVPVDEFAHHMRPYLAIVTEVEGER